MVSTAVLDKLTTTTIKMTTTTNNNLSVYIANTSVVNSVYFFGVFQDTVVGSSDLTIRTIVPPTISAEPYRKVMIAILFYRRILSLSSSPSVYLGDLTATIAAYFALLTSSAERIVDSIHHDYFHVNILRGIGFLESSGKATLVSNLANRRADIAFFTSRSTVIASDVDHRFLSTTLSPDFSLRLPHSVTSTTTVPVINLPASILIQPRVYQPASGPSLASLPSPTFAL